MSKHAKLIGAVALGAAAVTTFVVVQTAGKPAAVALGPGGFAAVVSPGDPATSFGGTPEPAGRTLSLGARRRPGRGGGR
jgi:hypothetical protein